MKKGKFVHERRKHMKKRVSIILIFTIIISSISLVGCGENFEEQIFEKLQNTYLLDTPLSRFFLDNEFEKTIDSHLVIYIQGENDSLDIDFFGRDLVKNIESFTYVNRIRFNPYDPDSRIRCTRYVVELHQNSKINLLYVAYRLSKLPGVFTVDAFVAGDALAAVPSDI